MAQQALCPREPLVLLAATGLVLAWSGVGPFERGTWFLEVAPVLIGAPILIATYSAFRLSPLLYRLLFLHAVILMVGGHYTYARVPVGFWMQDLLGFSRNHYDRLGHIAQGFIPAILAREVLLRLSALYELIEWWAAAIGGQSAESFLGTQGDVWDTQWDMFLALVGSVSAQLLLRQGHDRSLADAASLSQCM
jgi:putative membrane protein